MANKSYVKVKTNVMELLRLATGIKWLGKMDVLVGIPQETNADHGGITNAELLYIHTNGSPARGIPARPTIQPAVQDPAVKMRLQEMFKRAMLMAIMGNIPGAEKTYNQIGMIGANETKKKFGTVLWCLLAGHRRRFSSRITVHGLLLFPCIKRSTAVGCFKAICLASLTQIRTT